MKERGNTIIMPLPFHGGVIKRTWTSWKKKNHIIVNKQVLLAQDEERHSNLD